MIDKSKVISLLTPRNIYHFLQGNIRWFGDEFKVLPRHIKEQVIYRAHFCQDDCVRAGQCRYCGCSLPGKFYVTESCNQGKRFPDLMGKEEWEQYKIDNNFKIGK
jgi:hypothetical protein